MTSLSFLTKIGKNFLIKNIVFRFILLFMRGIKNLFYNKKIEFFYMLFLAIIKMLKHILIKI